MSSSKYIFTLDLRSVQSQISLPVTQGDTNRTLIISFSDGAKPYVLGEKATAMLSIVRPTGTPVQEYCEVEKDGSCATYNFSEYTVAVAGLHKCQLVLYNAEGKQIASPKFSIDAAPKLVTGDDVVIPDEGLSAIDAIYTAEARRAAAEMARAEAEAQRVSAEAARNEASTKAINDLNTVKTSIEQMRDKGEFDGVDGKTAYEYAKEGGYTGTEEDFAKKLASEYPTKLSELKNDSNFITEDDIPDVPVTSVNNKTGAVSLNASDVGARADNWLPTPAEIGAATSSELKAQGDALSALDQITWKLIDDHKVDTVAHNDIRLLIQGLADRVNAIANSTDVDLDDFKEIVAYIKANRGLIDAITTNKINYTDIINDLATNVTNRPLSAAQGVVLNGLIQNLINNKLDASALTSAINTALAQAKASGEFKGEDGKQGAPIYYYDGELLFATTYAGSGPDQFSNDTAKIVNLGDNELRVNDLVIDRNGILARVDIMYGKYEFGVEVLTLITGADGYTPIKGTDYYTEEDKAEMVQLVLAALPKVEEVGF